MIPIKHTLESPKISEESSPLINIKRESLPPSLRDSIEERSNSPSCWQHITNFFSSVFKCIMACFCCGRNRSSSAEIPELKEAPSPEALPSETEESDSSLSEAAEGNGPHRRVVRPLQPNPANPEDELDELLNSLEMLIQNGAQLPKAPQPKVAEELWAKTFAIPLGSMREPELDRQYQEVLKLEIREHLSQLIKEEGKIESILEQFNEWIGSSAMVENLIKINVWEALHYLKNIESTLFNELLEGDMEYLFDIKITTARNEVLNQLRNLILGWGSRYLGDQKYPLFYRQITLNEKLEEILSPLQFSIEDKRALWYRLLEIYDQDSLQQFCYILNGILQQVVVKRNLTDPSDSLNLDVDRQTARSVETFLGNWAKELRPDLSLHFSIELFLGSTDDEIKQSYIEQIVDGLRILSGALMNEADNPEVLKKLTDVIEAMGGASDVGSVIQLVNIVSNYLTIQLPEIYKNKMGKELDIGLWNACTESYQTLLGRLTIWLFYSLPINSAFEALRILETR